MNTSMFDSAVPRRWPLTTQLSLLFGAAITLMLVGASGFMYVQLVNELRAKEAEELKFDLHVQQSILAAAAARRHVDYWQREWQENSNAYRRFAWQVIDADGTVRAASSNWAMFARATQRSAPGNWIGGSTGIRPSVQQVLIDTIAVDRLAGRASGHGGVLRGALDISRDMSVLQHYREKLITIGALAILLALMLGWSLAKYGVAPLAVLARIVGRAERKQLRTQSESGRWPVELGPLVAAFDDMLAALERSHEQLSSVSSDLAHELGTPIGNVLAASSVTLARTRDAEQYQKALEVVLDEGNRLSRMLSSILFLMRADGGGQQVVRQRLSTGQEFDTLVDFFDLGFQEQDVILVATGAGDLVADPQLLRRALSTLLSEALRHACSGDAISLACDARRQATVITLDMRGAGIPAPYLAFLTERFDTARCAGAGLDCAGIELAVVRSIVMLHGGTIFVTGMPGTGTRVELHFPRFPGDRLPAPQPQLDK